MCRAPKGALSRAVGALIARKSDDFAKRFHEISILRWKVAVGHGGWRLLPYDYFSHYCK